MDQSKTTTHAEHLAVHRTQTLNHYTKQQQDAVLLLLTTAMRALDTGGGSTCAKLLLGLYNGNRFPFDLTDLRRLDGTLLQAAMTVIHMDASRTWCEVHLLLDAILNVEYGKTTGSTMELWAHCFKLKGRCNKAALDQVKASAV